MKFKQTKGKDLKFVSFFMEKESTEDRNATDLKSGFFLRSEILAMNGMRESSFESEDELVATVEQLIEQAKAEFPGFNPTVATHPNPRLIKYQHKHMGTTDTHARTLCNDNNNI